MTPNKKLYSGQRSLCARTIKIRSKYVEQYVKDIQRDLMNQIVSNIDLSKKYSFLYSFLCGSTRYETFEECPKDQDIAIQLRVEEL